MLRIYAVFGRHTDPKEELLKLRSRLQKLGFSIDEDIKLLDMEVVRSREPAIYVIESRDPCTVKGRINLHAVPCPQIRDQNIVAIWVCRSRVCDPKFFGGKELMSKVNGVSNLWVVRLPKFGGYFYIDGFRID